MKGGPSPTARLPQCHLVVTGSSRENRLSACGGMACASNSFPDLATMGASCTGWPERTCA